MKMEFHATLKKAMECMGIQELKSKQIESIESFVSGRDTFVSLPTGYGKSVILVEVVSVVFQQRPHISDLDSDILTSLAPNVHEKKIKVI